MSEPNSYTAVDYLRSIFSMLVFFLLLLFFTPVILFLLIISFGKLTNFVVEKIASFIARVVLAVAGIRFKVEMQAAGFPDRAVYIINHSSTIDMLTILALGLPRVRFVAKWQFQYNPIFFILGHLTGQVFIRRENSDKAVETLKRNVKRIRNQNLSILLAPEGSRKHPGIIGPFKKGPFRMAMDLEYPVVPIYFEGNRELSKGGFLVTRSGTCTAHIHPPVDTSGWRAENIDSHIEEIRNRYLQWAGVGSESAH